MPYTNLPNIAKLFYLEYRVLGDRKQSKDMFSVKRLKGG
jgi:hypothetical protein